MAQIRVDDFVGSSSESWSDAARNAISQMAGMADSIQGVDVLSQSAEVQNDEITEYRTTVRVSLHPQQLGISAPPERAALLRGHGR